MIYLAGGMSGDPAHPAKFAAAAMALRGAGFDVFNPVDHPTGTDLEGVALGVRLVAGSQCQGVAVLAGFNRSAGALLEALVAQGLGKPVRTVDEWGATAALAFTTTRGDDHAH